MKHRIAIVDADLIGRPGNHFPNLACIKLSSFYKKYGYQVQLEQDYTQLGNYTRVFIPKVFTNTPVPIELVNRCNSCIFFGGTGFYAKFRRWSA